MGRWELEGSISTGFCVECVMYTADMRGTDGWGGGERRSDV